MSIIAPNGICNICAESISGTQKCQASGSTVRSTLHMPVELFLCHATLAEHEISSVTDQTRVQDRRHEAALPSRREETQRVCVCVCLCVRGSVVCMGPPCVSRNLLLARGWPLCWSGSVGNVSPPSASTSPQRPVAARINAANFQYTKFRLAECNAPPRSFPTSKLIF